MEFYLADYVTPGPFVETGTLHGEGVLNAVRAGFREICSIDSAGEHYNVAVSNIERELSGGTNLPAIVLYNGSVADNLPAVCERVRDQQVTFLLDSHAEWCGGRSAGRRPLPVTDEIAIIGRHCTDKTRLPLILIPNLSLIANGGGGIAYGGPVAGIVCAILDMDDGYLFKLVNGAVADDVLIAIPPALAGVTIEPANRPSRGFGGGERAAPFLANYELVHPAVADGETDPLVADARDGALFQALAGVCGRLKDGEFLEAEQTLTRIILDHVGRPDAPSLFRIFQASPDLSLAARLDEVRHAVDRHNDILLKSCFVTLVGPWAMNELGGAIEGRVATYYSNACDASDALRTVRLFENRSDELLWVNINTPITTCNYRCPYCFLKHETKPDVKKLELMPRIIDRLAQIPRPIAVTYGPAGDILAVPATWPMFKNLAVLPNLKCVEIWTNLYRDLDGITDLFPVDRLAVVASYHPSQYPAHQFEEKSEAFFRRIAYLKDNAFDVSVNFVISSINMPYFETLDNRLRDLGVFLTVNPLQGVLNGDGKRYPEAYSDSDWLKIQKWTKNELYAFFAANKKAKVRCTAGVDHIDIRFDGNVSRCEHQAYWPTPQGYGNIFDEGGPLVDTVARYCWMDGCSCKSTIGYASPVVAEFERFGTQHHFVHRAPGDKGEHSYTLRRPPSPALSMAEAGADS